METKVEVSGCKLRPNVSSGDQTLASVATETKIKGNSKATKYLNDQAFHSAFAYNLPTY
jgi:hypothetical protein